VDSRCTSAGVRVCYVAYVCQHAREMGLSLRLGLVLFLGGCTAIVGADERKLGASPAPCNPKDPPSMCVCIDGTKSIQTCSAMGRLDPCRCPMAAAPTAGGAAK
jgi:hypothetical protein